MQINNHQIVDYDAVLDAKFGAEGTPERAEAEDVYKRQELSNGITALRKM